MGLKLFRHPVIAGRIGAGRAAQERQAVHSGAALRSHIQRTLYDLTTDGNTDQTRLRGCELLGKLATVQAFNEHLVIDQPSGTPEEMLEEIRKRLRAAFEDTA